MRGSSRLRSWTAIIQLIQHLHAVHFVAYEILRHLLLLTSDGTQIYIYFLYLDIHFIIAYIFVLYICIF